MNIIILYFVFIKKKKKNCNFRYDTYDASYDVDSNRLSTYIIMVPEHVFMRTSLALEYRKTTINIDLHHYCVSQCTHNYA